MYAASSKLEGSVLCYANLEAQRVLIEAEPDGYESEDSTLAHREKQ